MGALFEIERTLSFNTDKLVSGDEYDYVTRTSTNQGILRSTGFINSENINNAGTWSLGLLQMDFFYRKKNWYAGQFMRKIVSKIYIPENCIPFFTTLFNCQKAKLLSVLVRNVDETFRNLRIQLPVKNGKIDFDFMGNFIAELEAQHIAELEAQHIAELEAYLSVTGLKDTRLSPEEEQALRDLDMVEWEEYSLGDLFEIKTSAKRFDANKVVISSSGKYPYIVRMGSNNGQKGFLNEDEAYLNAGNTISFGQDTATMYYQEVPYFTGDKIKILSPQIDDFKKGNAQFFLTSMRLAFSKFSWGSSQFNVEVLKKQKVMLPTKHSKIDFDYTNHFISAIQKLVIRDVAAYNDKKLDIANRVINK